MLTRYWRVVGSDYCPPPPGTTVDGRRDWAKAAENRLRAALDRGEHPDPVLVAPELATLPRIDGGLLVDVCAWSEGFDPAFAERSVPRPGAVSLMTTEDLVPDPWSAQFAEQGSVLARRAQLHSLVVARWLEPVAGRLAERYGVLVELGGGMARRLPDVGSGPAYVKRGVLDPESCAMLCDWFELKRDDAAAMDERTRDGLVAAAIPPVELWPAMLATAQPIAAQFGLQADGLMCGMLRYDVGGSHPWHTDANASEPFSRNRTVSFSVLLGDEFTGGEFVTDDGVIPLGTGDLVAFTARTRHHVRPVTGGQRYVLVCFAESD